MKMLNGHICLQLSRYHLYPFMIYISNKINTYAMFQLLVKNQRSLVSETSFSRE